MSQEVRLKFNSCLNNMDVLLPVSVADSEEKTTCVVCYLTQRLRAQPGGVARLGQISRPIGQPCSEGVTKSECVEFSVIKQMLKVCFNICKIP